MMIDQRKIATAIEFLGLNGQCVCIHTSMRSFGQPVENGAAGLLNAFLQAGCTVMVPTFSDMYEAPPVKAYMPAVNGAGDYSYFHEKCYEDAGTYTSHSNQLTTEEMGIFPQIVLEHPERVRGGNHLNSFAAIGPKASFLASCQSNKDVYAPFSRLCKADGFVLLIGVGLNRATAIHYAEQKAGRNPFIRWSKDPAGNTIPVCAGGCSDGFEHFSPYLTAIETRITLGNSLWRCFRVRALIKVCAELIRQHPEMTHCKISECDRCNDAISGGPDFTFP